MSWRYKTAAFQWYRSSCITYQKISVCPLPLLPWSERVHTCEQPWTRNNR